MADNNFNFRRMTDPLLLPIAATATQFTVAANYFTTGAAIGATSFWVVNANNFWVRLKGSNGTYSAVTDTTGWLFPPGFAGAFSTQFPDFMSTLSVTRQGLTAGTGTLEVSYGGGV